MNWGLILLKYWARGIYSLLPLFITSAAWRTWVFHLQTSPILIDFYKTQRFSNLFFLAIHLYQSNLKNLQFVPVCSQFTPSFRFSNCHITLSHQFCGQILYSAYAHIPHPLPTSSGNIGQLVGSTIALDDYEDFEERNLGLPDENDDHSTLKPYQQRLSLSAKYVKDWKKADAFREFCQNWRVINSLYPL